MANNKTIYGRIEHKHDTEADWKKSSLIPLQGEIIVYDKDSTYNYERFKIGDGNTSVNELPFADAHKADVEHTHNTLYVNLVDKLSSAENWSSVAYGGGKFVAVAISTDTAAYSDDGITWKSAKLPHAGSWMCVTYGNNRFVALASNSSTAAYSLDGITWNTMTLPRTDVWVSVAYGNGCFIAVPSGGESYIYSYGGTNWYVGTLPTSEFWSDITHDGSEFIITGEYSPVILAGSHNNWTQITNNSGVNLTQIASDDNQFSVALGGQYDSMVCWTADGLTWTKVTVNLDMMSDIAYGNGKFVVIGSGDKALYSSDGKTWTQTTLPESLSWSVVTYGDDKFVAIAKSSIVSAISYDGINWTISESTMQDKDGNDVVPYIGGMLSSWSKIYDSGEITSDVNAFSNIDVSGYKHIMVAIKCVNTTKSSGGVSGAVIFKGQDGRSYAFKNILPNLIKNTTGTSGGMAMFQIVNGFIVCENAMRAQSAENMLSSTEGYGADNLTPVGGGVITCTSPIPTLMISNANLSSSYYYGAGSRAIVWGCRV